MELDWIEDFLALADLGVFSKAAQRRNVTQPAFTRRIRKLEYALGAVLFDRSVHPVVPTPAGEEFRPVAIEMLRLMSSSKARLRGAQGGPEAVTIASLQALAISYLPPLVGRLYQGRQPPAIRVLADDFAGCLEALLTGSADILLTYTHPEIVTSQIEEGFVARAVAEDLLIAVSAPGPGGRALHDLEDERIPWLAYSEESFLGKLTTRVLAGQAELVPRLVRIYTNSMADGLKAAARAGLGVAWLPRRVVQDEIERGVLCHISTPAQEAPIRIAMIRDAAPRPRPVERLWAEILRHVDAAAQAPPPGP